MSILVDLDPDIPGKIKFINPEFRWKELIKTLPGSKYPNSKFGDGWRVPLTWQMCLALRTTFGADLELGPGLVQWATDYRASIVDPAMHLREQTDAEGYAELFPFQRAGVRFMATTGRAILTDGLGAGKTRQAVSVLRFLYEQGENPFPALVVAPNSTLIAWGREAETVWPGLKVNIIKGSMAKRRKLLEEPAHIYVINWEGIRSHSRLAPYGSIALKKCSACGGADPDIKESSCQAHPRELNALEFNTVIADEVHRAKDPKSQQTRALKAATANAKFRFGLSGTPIASAPDDLWSPLNWLLPEAYPSHTKYVDRFLDVSFNAWGQPTVIGVKPHMEKEFFGGLDPHLRHMPKDLVLKHLPPVVRERRDVEMAPKQRKAYTQMRDKMVAQLDNGEMLISTSPLTKMTRMLQFSSSYAEIEVTEKVDPITQEVHREEHVKLADPSCKLDAFMDDLEDFGDESVIVFAVSRQLIEMLSARLEKAKIPHGLITGAQSVEERQEHMDAFQRGETKFILCTIAAGGTGITLTQGSVMVFLQRSWSMIENVQSEGRGHRIGSEIHDVVRIIDYVTIDSAEEVVHTAVAAKGDQLERILRSQDLMLRMLTENKIDPPDLEAAA